MQFSARGASHSATSGSSRAFHICSLHLRVKLWVFFFQRFTCSVWRQTQTFHSKAVAAENGAWGTARLSGRVSSHVRFPRRQPPRSCGLRPSVRLEPDRARVQRGDCLLLQTLNSWAEKTPCHWVHINRLYFTTWHGCRSLILKIDDRCATDSPRRKQDWLNLKQKPRNHKNKYVNSWPEASQYIEKWKTHALEWLPEVKLDYFACDLREFARDALHIFASNPHPLWPAEEYSDPGHTLPGLAGKGSGFLQDSLPVICGHYEITCIGWGFLSECGKEDDKGISSGLLVFLCLKVRH